MNKLTKKLEILHDCAQTKLYFIENCEQIVDDFTVKFIEWCSKEEYNINFNTENLLQTFKDKHYK